MTDGRADFEAATRDKYQCTPSSFILGYPQRDFYAFELTWRDEDVRDSFKFYVGEEPHEIVGTGIPIASQMINVPKPHKLCVRGSSEQRLGSLVWRIDDAARARRRNGTIQNA